MTAALGFFDGVHVGHQAILLGADRAVTFRTHPLAALAPARAPRLLMTLEERVAAIRACGVREVEVLDFTPAFAALPPGDFAARYLLGTDAVRCGSDARFGCGGAGTAEWLAEHGFAVTIVPYAVYGGERISSTRIRTALAAGDLTAAAAMLGRPYTVSCMWHRGKGVGAKIGFPTVNLVPVGVDPPLPRGAYVVEVEDGRRGVANWGIAPTMGDGAWPQNVLEVHFPDLAPDEVPSFIGGVRVSFWRFLRPERRFASIADLVRQLSDDVRACRECPPRTLSPGCDR